YAYRAADAAEAVVVEYEPLAAAARPAVPAPAIVHEGWRDNRAGVNEARVGDAARGLAEADVVIETRVTYSRVTGVPIEGRAARGRSRWNDRRARDRLHARPRRVSDARRRHDGEHDQSPGRSLSGAELPRARRQPAHHQDVCRRLSRRRTSRGGAGPRPAPRS